MALNADNRFAQDTSSITAGQTLNQRRPMGDQQPDNDPIDLAEVFSTIWHNMGLIIIAALIAGILTMAVTVFLIHPKYQSGFTAFVNNRTSQDATQSVQSGDVTASQSLAYTYANIMTSRPVLEDSLKEAGLEDNGKGDGYTYDTIKDAVETNIQDNTQLVQLTVTLKDPEEAYKLASAISKVAPGYVADIVDGTSMKIVSKAILPTEPSSPNVPRNTIIGLLVGALLMIAIVIIRSLTDTRITSSQELEDTFGIPVIGMIPSAESVKSSHGYGKYGYGYYKKPEQKTTQSRKNGTAAGEKK